MSAITIYGLSEALSPVTHMMGVAGNEAIIAREQIATTQGIRWVPFLSGNALRHKLIREPGILWLLDRWGLTGQLSKSQLNFLMCGGNLTESSQLQSTRVIAEMHRIFPLLKLLGGSLPNQIIGGCLDVLRGTLVCRENRQSLSQWFPVDLPAHLLSAQDFVGDFQYTRCDASKLAQPSDEPGDLTNLMIYSGQAVTRHAVFAHGFVIRNAEGHEVGALLHAIAQWRQAGGTIGGGAAKGHGRLSTDLFCEEDLPFDSLVEAYVTHCDAVREEGIAWLHAAFSRPAKEAKKTKAKKTLLVEETEEEVAT